MDNIHSPTQFVEINYNLLGVAGGGLGKRKDLCFICCLDKGEMFIFITNLSLSQSLLMFCLGVLFYLELW